MSKCYSDITREEAFCDKNFHNMVKVDIVDGGDIKVSLTMTASLSLPKDAIEYSSQKFNISDTTTELFAERMNIEMKDVFAVLRYKLQDKLNEKGQENERSNSTNDIQQ